MSRRLSAATVGPGAAGMVRDGPDGADAAEPTAIGRLRAFVTGWPFVVGLAWFVRFATLGHVLPWQTPIWAGWFDQSRYLASAIALAHGDLSAAQHWYPLGYALAAAPFAWVLPADPFLVLDLVLFIATCRGFQRVVARLGVTTWPATVCFLATTLVQTGLASAWAQPWTSSLSAALIWWLLDRTITIAEEAKVGPAPVRRDLLALGMLAGALPLVRPVDAIVGATCLLVALAALVRRRGLYVPALLAIGAGVAAVGLPYLALHLAIYGPRPTPYMVEAAKTGFAPADIGWKAYVLLVSPRPWFPDPYSRGLLAVLPWIVPGLAGLVARMVVGDGRDRLAIALVLGTFLPVSALMLTYVDLQPPGLWYFGNVHYLKWGMPILGCGLLLWPRLLRTATGRRALAVATVALVLPLGIRVTPARVGDHAPARMLTFRGDTHRDWQEAYFATVTIRDAGGLLRNVGGFHQVPDAGGERAIAIARPFLGDERRHDPGERDGVGERPDARWGERLSYGWP